jgi:REP element-mobilizing transposase RayT
MRFEAGSLYHVYNRTHSREPAFHSADNYVYFLRKVERLRSWCDILAYCLMPNHFHILLHAKPEGIAGVSNQERIQKLSRRIGNMLSSYTQAINLMRHKSGSLFQPRTKARLIESDDYGFICFHYIHQNPWRAGLVKKLEGWEYSSFREYLSGREEICNHSLTAEVLGVPLDTDRFYKESCELTIDRKAEESMEF